MPEQGLYGTDIRAVVEHGGGEGVTAFNFIFSVLRYQDETNVVDENGEEKNHFKKVNIINFAKYVDQMKRIGVRIVEGKEDSNYDSWIIYKME